MLGTVRSQIVFQCQRDDAEVLAKSYQPRLTANDLMGLGTYEIAIRPSVSGQTLAPLTGTTLPLPSATRDGSAAAEGSRKRVGRPRSEVEAALEARRAAAKATDGPGTATSGTGKNFGRRRKESKASETKTNEPSGDSQAGDATKGAATPLPPATAIAI